MSCCPRPAPPRASALREGEEISANLRELGDALRTNAERLLRDVRAAHTELTSRLDGADPSHWNGVSPSRPAVAAAPDPELDVPEFIPRARARQRR